MSDFDTRDDADASTEVDASDPLVATDPAPDAGGEVHLDAGGGELSVEALLDDLERVSKERDGYLDDVRRLAAEFANYRKQTDKRYAEMVEQAGARLAETLLPVLDACDAALAQGADDVAPVHQSLLSTLQKSGLALLRPLNQPFDPNQHEAVVHEEGDGDVAQVTEVLRTGYLWNGRVLRPALVKVRG